MFNMIFISKKVKWTSAFKHISTDTHLCLTQSYKKSFHKPFKFLAKIEKINSLCGLCLSKCVCLIEQIYTRILGSSVRDLAFQTP